MPQLQPAEAVGRTALCLAMLSLCFGCRPTLLMEPGPSLSSAFSAEGEVLVRFEMGREEGAGDLSVGLQVNGARLARLKSYFFETPEDAFYPTAATWKCRAR
ncbi:MAG: hypothetical protein PVJ27_11230, partial [Candidatus Brocadiaceae bacterium]